MKKLFSVIAGLLLAFGAHASDSYLYWMLDEVGDTRLWFDYAKVATFTTGDDSQTVTGYLTFKYAQGASGDKYYGEYYNESSFLPEVYALLPSDFTKMSFFVELYSADGQIVGVSTPADYELLRDFIYTDKEMTGATTPYHFSASVPEPSCGLLVLFGLGLLGLKRRERRGES